MEATARAGPVVDHASPDGLLGRARDLGLTLHAGRAGTPGTALTGSTARRLPKMVWT